MAWTMGTDAGSEAHEVDVARLTAKIDRMEAENLRLRNLVEVGSHEKLSMESADADDETMADDQSARSNLEFPKLFSNYCGVVGIVNDQSCEIFEDQICFGFQRPDLSVPARDVLNILASRLRTCHHIMMGVFSHNDTKEGRNLELSKSRSLSVINYLRENIEIKKFFSVEFGDIAPTVATGVGVREPRNRRSVMQAYCLRESNNGVSLQ